ncbi:PREDICTED: neuropeptide FF receptor 2-like [Branchiostoma belcheri]|uniref:Neuropeptide FF receptor 2-like n=1 Tax=Branchiostoma belcheri TaxID=7741 RepID=A0A6P4ZLU6_BRABE|nr:PREDICTED: neuropeptide FF receptor 2-like [Branchiostoma belcheri]
MSWLNLSCEDDFVCPNRSSNSTVVPPWSSYQHDTPVTVLYILVYSLVFILCVLGNLAVCCVVAKTRQLHTATFYFIFNLAVADLLVALFCMPFTLVAHILVEYQFGDFMCRLTALIQGLSVAASVYTLTAIAADRYKAILFPHDGPMNMATMKKVLVAIWMAALVIMVPQVFVIQVRNVKRVDRCTEIWPDLVYKKVYSVTVILLIYILPLMVMTFLYVRIAEKIWFRAGLQQQRGGNKSDSVRRSEFIGSVPKRRKRVIKMLIVVVTLFMLSFLPLYVCWMLDEFGNMPEWQENVVHHFVYPFAHWLSYFNSCVNPIVYGLFNRDIRKNVDWGRFSLMTRSTIITDKSCRSRRRENHQAPADEQVYNVRLQMETAL